MTFNLTDIIKRKQNNTQNNLSPGNPFRADYVHVFYFCALILISVLAFWVRWRGIEHITADIETCLIPWSESMRTGEGVRILSTFDGDYNMPYVTVLWLLNYLPGRTISKVKCFSILFDYLGAAAAGLIVTCLVKTERSKVAYIAANPAFGRRLLWLFTYTVVLFYPVTIMNSAYWGQCDFIYVTFILYMMVCLLRGHYKTAFALLGCAFSFKLQAVLILPFLVIYYWKKRTFSALNFLMVPLVMELLCIPAILGGCSVFVPFSVYLRQLGRYPYMYVFYPNFWALFKNAPYYIFSNVANFGIVCGLGVFAVAVITGKKKISSREWMLYATWTLLFMMCFLPCMHERYGFILEIFAILYAILDYRSWWLPVIIGAGATVAYLQVTFARNYFGDQWIATAYLLALGLFTCKLVWSWKEGDRS